MPPDNSDKSKRKGGRGGGYDIKKWLEALKEIEQKPASTKQIHEKVTEKIGFEPSDKTTQNKLNILAEQGAIIKRDIGGSNIWDLTDKPPKQDVLELIKNLGIATTEELTKELEKPQEKVKETLYELKEEEKIELKPIENKEVWYIP